MAAIIVEEHRTPYRFTKGGVFATNYGTYDRTLWDYIAQAGIFIVYWWNRFLRLIRVKKFPYWLSKKRTEREWEELRCELKQLKSESPTPECFDQYQREEKKRVMAQWL